jgi:Cytidylyltransferase-like
VVKPLECLLRGDLPSLCQTAAGELKTDATPPAALLCGSFNPLHAGHLRLVEAAEARLRRPVAFEIGIVNADKPALDAEEVWRRLAQFAGKRRDVWLTRQPTFLDKSLLFPGAAFVVGYDTAVRILEPRFYGGDEGVLVALRAFDERGCPFLVAGRAFVDGRFRTADDLSVPAEFRHLFTGLTEAEFRMDVSSTAIRAAGQA